MMQYFISAVLSEIVKEFELTEVQLLELFDCNKDDSASVFLGRLQNPYSKSEKMSMSVDTDIDKIYPGRTVNREE